MAIGTLNNPDVQYPDFSPEEYLNRWNTQGEACYCTGQMERGANGTDHLQYFVQFKNKKRIGTLKAICPHSHF